MKAKFLSVCLVAAGKMLLAQAMPDMPGMANMPGMNMSQSNPAEDYEMNLASGTALNPEAGALPMAMKSFGAWRAMFMGNAFLVDSQESGPRGGDKLYSTNWAMASIQHRAGRHGAFEIDTMLSLEPATITNRRYPELFQTGETAYGKPIVDGQHPHNAVMALGVHYTYQLGEKSFFDLYAAPVGDPALGPVAYPHRASAAELPESTISHHWQDATHISDDVVTAGIADGAFKLEASGFHGGAPNENRWTIEQGAIDSWSARLWYTPTANWAAQVSGGRMARPEGTPGDQTRMTASLAYSRGRWSSSLVWGRNHDTESQHNLNSYLAETVIPLSPKNLFTARAELVDKDELVASGISYRIGAYTAGYIREIAGVPHFATGVGFNMTAYMLPDALKPVYGNRPVGGNIFIRFRFKG